MSDIAPRTLNIAGAQMAHAAHGAAYVFSVGKHARFCGSPYENKRPPNGGLLFWQGHKGSNSGHAVLETAALPTELYPYLCRFDSAVRACSEPSHAGAGDGNRTRTASLEGWNSTIELHPQNQRLIIVSHGRVHVKRFLIFLPPFPPEAARYRLLRARHILQASVRF